MRIKQPIEHSFNAIMIQIITAMITFVLLTLISKESSYTKELVRLKRAISENIDYPIETNSTN